MTRLEALDKARARWGEKAGAFVAWGEYVCVTPDDSWGAEVPVYGGGSWEEAFAEADREEGK